MRLYKTALTLASASASAWQADTLFGHLCWGLAHREGGEVLERFLARYAPASLASKPPPVLLSDGFPEEWLPRPLLPRMPVPAGLGKGQRIAFQQAAKAAAQASWLSLDAFNAIRLGAPSVDGAAPAEIVGASSTPKNQVDRLTGTATALFDLIGYAVPRVTVYWRIEDDCLGVVGAFLEDLCAGGFGKRRSVGYGHVREASPLAETDDFPPVPHPNGFVSLSRFVPAAGDPTDGFWTVQVKYGKLGEERAASANPFKRPLVQLACGSCFYDRPVRPWYGRLVRGLSDEHDDVVHYGFALALPVRLP